MIEALGYRLQVTGKIRVKASVSKASGGLVDEGRR